MWLVPGERRRAAVAKSIGIRFVFKANSSSSGFLRIIPGRLADAKPVCFTSELWTFVFLPGTLARHRQGVHTPISIAFTSESWHVVVPQECTTTQPGVPPRRLSGLLGNDRFYKRS